MKKGEDFIELVRLSAEQDDNVEVTTVQLRSITFYMFSYVYALCLCVYLFYADRDVAMEKCII